MAAGDSVDDVSDGADDVSHSTARSVSGGAGGVDEGAHAYMSVLSATKRPGSDKDYRIT